MSFGWTFTVLSLAVVGAVPIAFADVDIVKDYGPLGGTVVVVMLFLRHMAAQSKAHAKAEERREKIVEQRLSGLIAAHERAVDRLTAKIGELIGVHSGRVDARRKD